MLVAQHGWAFWRQIDRVLFVMHLWAYGLQGRIVINQERRCSPARRSSGIGSRNEGPDWKGALMILAAVGLFVLVPAMCAYFEIP